MEEMIKENEIITEDVKEEVETVEAELVEEYQIPDIDSDDIDTTAAEEMLEKMIDENIQDVLVDKYGLEGEDAMKFANTIIAIRHNRPVKDLYDTLPEQLRTQIDTVTEQQGVNLPKGMSKKTYKNNLSRVILKDLIHEMEYEAIDLEKAMNDLVPTPTELYSETNRELIEDKFPEAAEKIKETDPERARKLMDMRQGFIDAYKFEPMYEVLKNTKVIKSVRRCENIWSRIDQQYVKMAGVCKFNLYPLIDIATAISKLGFTETQSKRITTLFVYTYTDGMENFTTKEEYNDIYKNSFANYFEANMINLSISPEMITDFSKIIKENLTNLSNHIDTVISEREAELSNKKKKEGD